MKKRVFRERYAIKEMPKEEIKQVVKETPKKRGRKKSVK